MQEEPNNYNEFPFPHTVFGFVATISVIILYFIGGSYLTFALAPAGNIETNPTAMRLAQTLAQVLFMLLPAFAVSRLSPIGTRALLRADSPSIQLKHWIVVLLAIPLVQMFAYGWESFQSVVAPPQLAQWLAEQEQSTQQTYITLLGGSGAGDFLTALAVGALIPAIAEEVLFRGVMQRSVEQHSGVPVAIVHTAMLFTFIHFNPAQSIPLLALAVLLSVVAASSRSLIPGTIIHFLNNALAVSSIHIAQVQSLDTAGNNLPLPVAILLLLLSGASIVACAWWLLQKPKPRIIV
ncbi:MAG: CPBP family intramembrane glutamic endopeptidase [Candidatus Kapaibacterium sp.]|nr:CPBP family intramembrane metalloprotease [Bacteroidota bacterium]